MKYSLEQVSAALVCITLVQYREQVVQSLFDSFPSRNRFTSVLRLFEKPNGNLTQEIIEMSRFLITGGTGSFGKTMLQNLLDTTEDEIVILSRDEEKQDALRNTLRSPRVHYRIGDIRDRKSVDDAMAGVLSRLPCRST